MCVRLLEGSMYVHLRNSVYVCTSTCVRSFEGVSACMYVRSLISMCLREGVRVWKSVCVSLRARLCVPTCVRVFSVYVCVSMCVRLRLRVLCVRLRVRGLCVRLARVFLCVRGREGSISGFTLTGSSHRIVRTTVGFRRHVVQMWRCLEPVSGLSGLVLL